MFRDQNMLLLAAIKFQKSKISNLSIFFVLVSIRSFAQIEYSTWYFGENAGLKFQDNQVIELNDGATDSFEEFSSISDEFGNILLYTDGKNIHDFSHKIIKGGDSLSISGSSTQSLFINKPNSSSIYYLFDLASQADAQGAQLLTITRDTNNNFKVDKIDTLLINSTEKVAATYHKNGTDIWVFLHEWNSNNFYKYLITKDTLILEPIIQPIGTIHSGDLSALNAIGEMKFSPNGEYLALVQGGENRTLDIFRFNSITGVLEEFFTKTFSETNYPNFRMYGVEFSPNSKYLYFTFYFGSDRDRSLMFQFDVEKRKENIIYRTSEYLGGLSLAYNGKIYCSVPNTHKLYVIENPNFYYKSTYFSITNLVLEYGLPGISLPSSITRGITKREIYAKFPNAFSPNSDGINDQFLPIEIINVLSINLKIFNRNGINIFQSNSFDNPWKGGVESADTYYYTIDLFGVSGEKKTIKGIINLLK